MMGMTHSEAIQRVADLEAALDAAQDEIAGLKSDRDGWKSEAYDWMRRYDISVMQASDRETLKAKLEKCNHTSTKKWDWASTGLHTDTYIDPYIKARRRIIQAACDWAWRRDYAYMDNGADELIAAVHAYNELVGKGDEK